MTDAAPVDIRDAGAVADALLAWARKEHGVVELAGPLHTAGDGLDNVIHFVEVTGSGLPDAWRSPLVLRIHRTPDRFEVARREAAVQDWAADLGYPAPRVLRVFAPGELLDVPVQVMERAPGTTMIHALQRAPARAFALVRRLAALHQQLHGLPIEGWPDAGGPRLADRRLHMVRVWAAALGDARLQDALARAEPLVPVLDGAPLVACHGDFHPLNVLVAGDDAAVIDWTDAALGDRHGDVARTALLFHFAALASKSRVERVVLGRLGPLLGRTYLRAYRRGVPLDRGRLRRWEAVHALHGWAQISALHAGAFDDAGERADVPLGLAAWLARRFERAMSA